MNDTVKISEQLREQREDLLDLYLDAKLQENSTLMEKLIKSMAALAKQIKDHEIHERETLKRVECMNLANQIGATVGKALKKHFPEDFRTDLVIDDIFESITSMVETA